MASGWLHKVGGQGLIREGRLEGTCFSGAVGRGAVGVGADGGDSSRNVFTCLKKEAGKRGTVRGQGDAVVGVRVGSIPGDFGFRDIRADFEG
jgi:hypothetical protein